MNIYELIHIMIRCLILTIGIEVFIGFLFKINKRKDIFTIIIVNVITNPIVVTIPLFLYYRYGHNGYLLSLFILEVLTVVLEGIIYKIKFEYKRLNPFYVSLLLNLSSYLIGELINRSFWKER